MSESDKKVSNPLSPEYAMSFLSKDEEEHYSNIVRKIQDYIVGYYIEGKPLEISTSALILRKPLISKLINELESFWASVKTEAGDNGLCVVTLYDQEAWEKKNKKEFYVFPPEEAAKLTQEEMEIIEEIAGQVNDQLSCYNPGSPVNIYINNISVRKVVINELKKIFQDWYEVEINYYRGVIDMIKLYDKKAWDNREPML